MSYEGYTQVLCAKGHQQEMGIFDDGDNAKIGSKCKYKGCKEKIVWVNSVDLTNGSFEDEACKIRIDGYVDLKIDKRIKCKECGHEIEVTYKIPKRKDK